MEENLLALFTEFKSLTAPLLRNGPITLEEIETGYSSAVDTWTKVKNLIRHGLFENERQEIDFFSCVKPRFTGQCEFFQLLYQYRLFCPPDKLNTAAFRTHELNKIARFNEAHASFLNFYRSRRVDPVQNREYFLRRNFDPDLRSFARPYDSNPNYFTNADWIVTQFIGNLRYRRFILQEERYPPPPHAPSATS